MVVLRWLLLALAILAGAAVAGQNCSERPLAPAEVRAGLLLALDVRNALDRSGAEVAIVSRVGRDLSAYGLRYSHVSFAWRDHPRGAWTMVHELNTCGTADSALFDQGIADFFLDDLFAYETKIILPSSEVQQKLARALREQVGARVHEAHYNLVAYAWGTRYQNSNQWLLETFAAALADRPVASREQAQTWLRYAGYRPARVHIDAMTRLGGRMFRANVAFDDHPFDRRMAGQIDLVSAESVMDFMQRVDPAASAIVLGISEREN